MNRISIIIKKLLHCISVSVVMEKSVFLILSTVIILKALQKNYF